MVAWITKNFFQPHILIFLGVILTAIAEVLREKKKIPRLILFLGIGIAGIGALWSAFQDRESQRGIIELQREIIDSQGEIVDSQRKSIDSQRKNIELQREIIESQRQIIDNITGGDSYCYVEVALDPHGLRNFFIKHVGEYIVYDVTVIVYDQSKRKELAEEMGGFGHGLTSEEYNRFIQERDVIGNAFTLIRRSEICKRTWPSLPPGSIAEPILRVELPDNKQEQRYLVKIYARNGIITQPIKFLKVNGKWEMSMRVQRHDNIKQETIELRNALHPDVPLEEGFAGE